MTLHAVGTECAGIIAALLNVSAQMVLLVKTIVQVRWITSAWKSSCLNGRLYLELVISYYFFVVFLH